MAMKAQDVLRLVSGALQDLEPGMEKRWPWTGGATDRVGLLDFLNAAQRAIVMERPDSCAITEVIQLQAGMRQTIPSKSIHGATHDATGFCCLIRNMGDKAGTKPGRAILLSPQSAILAWQDPQNKRMLVRTGSIDNYAYDRAMNPYVYWVYPAVPTGRLYVEATYYAMPDDITAPTQALSIPDAYGQAMVHHILASIFSADSESSNSGKAQYHMEWYQKIMATKLAVDTRMPKAFTSSAGR